MTKRPSWQFAVGGALIIECFLCVMVHRFGHIGGDGPDFWGAVGLFTELPGAVIGEKLFGVTSPAVVVLGFVSGAAEVFLALWAVLGVIRGPLRHFLAEPCAPPNGGPAERFGNSGAGGAPPSVS